VRIRLVLTAAVSTVASAAGCAGHGPRPITIAAPAADTVLSRYMATRAAYQCRASLLYERSGPRIESCARQVGDTTFLLDRDRSGRIVAAGWELMVPLDGIDAATAVVQDSMTARYGSADSCVSRAGTLRRWHWWPAGAYTVQVRLVDPSPVYPVKRGRIEVQAIPASSIVCMTWLHPPRD
jgi:hypothetical protein